MKKTFKNLKNEDGQAVVEFAIILPLLILLICGVIEFGWLFSAKIATNNCAREGARYAAVNSHYATYLTETIDWVTSVAPNSIKDGLNTTVSLSNAYNMHSGDITVKVDSYVEPLTFIGATISRAGKINISSSVTMKAE
ncbi:MAG: TadE/TadG family type IV pilus assembly protein [Eubacteriales bacterium]|nr:TadE/TadG family type IV pilus assembly protein [Eubacteriales bacterium]